MLKKFLIIAAILGAASVLLGAFGAHILKGLLNADTFQTFETAVRYQFYHVFALLAAAVLFQQFPGKYLVWSCRFFIAGIVLFSGSLYLLTYFLSQGNTNMNWLGIVTPFGGISFIAGWIFIVLAVFKKR